MEAVVVGAGVSGLTTAHVLLNEGWTVRIVCRELPVDTVSSVAAATWTPFGYQPHERVMRWANQSWLKFEELSTNCSTAGVRMRRGILYLRDVARAQSLLQDLPDFTDAGSIVLPKGVVAAKHGRLPFIDMSIYLPWLHAQIVAAGGTIERGSITDLVEVSADVVVNCTGLGARKLGPDDSMFGDRGQMVVVDNPGIEDFIMDRQNPGGLTHIYPRESSIVLGGANSRSEQHDVDASQTEAILGRCFALEPKLRGANVQRVLVGIRPGRPTIRVERETRDGITIVHNYGHWGAGVTVSWGCALEAAALCRIT